MRLSKRKLTTLKIVLVSPQLEQLLLLSYLVLFSIIVYLGSYESSSPIDNYDIRSNILSQFNQTRVESISSYNDLYEYLNDLMLYKLWPSDGSRNPNLGIGSLRMAQFRVQDRCQSISLNSNCHEISCFKRLFSNDCNLLFEPETEATSYEMLYSNSTTCALPPDCNEYNYTTTEIPIVSGSFGTYTGMGFVIDFDFQQNETLFKLNALKNEKWLDRSTRAIAIQWTVHNTWSDSYFISTIFIENPGNNIFSTEYKLQTAYFYLKNSDELEGFDKQPNKYFVIMIYLLFFLNTLTYIGKIVIELSIGVNKVTNILEGFNIVLQMFLVFARYTNIDISLELDLDDCSQKVFRNFQTQAQLHQFELIVIGLTSIFYPFRFFQLMSHFKFFTPVKIYLNTLYRTLPGVILYAVLIVILYVSWAQGFYLIFSPYLYNFKTYFDTLLTISFKRFYVETEYKELLKTRDFSYLEVSGFIIYWAQVLFFVFFVGLFTHLYKKSTGFERGSEIPTPEKDQLYKEIRQIREQVAQIYQVKIMGVGEREAYAEFKNKKIVAWFLNRNAKILKENREEFFKTVNQEVLKEHEVNLELNEHKRSLKEQQLQMQKFQSMSQDELQKEKQKRQKQEQMQPKQVEFIEFENFHQFKPFLDSLFKLKPSLITTFSHDKFRIVIENYTASTPRFNLSKLKNSQYQPLKQIDEEQSAYQKKNGSASYNINHDLLALNIYQTQEVIEYLSEIGCKVPVLLYSDASEEDQTYFKKIMKLKKKYKMLMTTNDIEDVKKYCMMGDNYHQSLKRSHISNIS